MSLTMLLHAGLEGGQCDVGVDPRDHYAVELARLCPRPGDAVELDARSLQQRLPKLGLEVHVPVGGVSIGQCVDG